MRIKEKLYIGMGFLFLLIVLLAVTGTYYINALKRDSQNIIVANYNSLSYSRNMIRALDSAVSDQQYLKVFEDNLGKQEQNITEIGERELTDKLKGHFKQLQECHLQKMNCFNEFNPLLRNDISKIMEINMEAIHRKSDIANQTASAATFWIALSGTLCFILAFTLLINLPSNISEPIEELTNSIKGIAYGNYSQRVKFEKHNEFGELAKSFNSMAAKLEEYNNSNLFKILYDKKRIETLINNMHDPVIGLDEELKVLFVNAEALKILNANPEDILGKYAEDLAIFNDLIKLLIHELTENNAQETNAISKQPIKIYADNKESYFQKEIINLSITPTGEKEIRNIGYVIMLKNITSYKELDFAKSNFIAMVSHELKTPIASIKLGLQLLEKDPSLAQNQEQKQLINSIKEDSDRLLKITGELLNLSQLETGNIQLNMQQSNPYKILKYAIDAIKVSAEQKQIQLLLEADPNLPEVKADAEKTAWVLINFLTNAIRFSPYQSKITIKANIQSNSVAAINETPFVLFSITDQGPGIESRYRDKIFDRYFQIPGSNRTGTGLGLTISKEFIEAQGGTIGLESEIGSGSTFYFTLMRA